MSPTAADERQAIIRAAFRLHLAYWIEIDPRIALRIMRLIEDIMRDPYRGIGKPEPLRHRSAGAWSRRITDEHRIIYEVNPAGVVFSVARGHYNQR
jgi:toxin YoeB